MRTNLLALLCVLSLAGCPLEVIERDGGTSSTDGPKCPPLPDLMPQPAKCAAAKGIGGDNLLCIDFSSLPDQQLGSALPPELNAWSFNNPPNCWEIKSGKLEIKDFGMFDSTCTFTMPSFDLNDADKQKYQNITLSIVQKVDLDPGTAFPNQFMQIYNGTANAAFLLTQMTGSQPEQQTVITIDKQKLPAVMQRVAKYLFQVSSSMANNTKKGIQISSLAVNGIQ